MFAIMLALAVIAFFHAEIIKRRFPPSVRTLMRSEVFAMMIGGAAMVSLVGPIIMSIFYQDHLKMPMFMSGWIYGLFYGRWLAWYKLQFNMENIMAQQALNDSISGAHTSENTTKTHPQYDDFADSGAANDGFGFDAGRFGAKPPPPPPQPDENAPRGWDKRHPDDAKLWAIVDDPDASDGERRNAMDMILKRQARRRGGNGGGGGGGVVPADRP